MFVFSKLFWIAIQPLVMSLLLMLFSLLALAAGSSVLSGLFGGLAALILTVTLFTNAGTMAMLVLERRFSRPTLDQPPAAAIILGGGINTSLSAARGGYALTRAGERYIEAVRLSRLYPAMKIVVSGGDNAIGRATEGETAPALRLFAALGVDENNLLEEPASRNTAENAAFTGKLLRQTGFRGDLLLITSAYHMPRAMSLFARQGIAVLPWPTDFRTRGDERFGLSLDRPSSNADITSTAIREWFGLLSYRMMGRTKTFLPSARS
ncbi:YdcF family protein [Martelella alba]|uniref:YdcF family protein n=1 Tax=Martelella alba TaxID=2590451 RepID=A0A506UG60_9HYPH|nr:YdcF family protein [Martelella alba]TPW32194.1 YdcF family protein [Martelella alba]